MGWSLRAVLGAFLVVGVALAVVGLGATTVVAQGTNETGGDVSFGAQVSAFMQSTAADANGSVDRGMWRWAVDDASDPDAAVSSRAERLRTRLTELEERSASLEPRGDGIDIVYTARASAVRVRLANLRQSIDETAAVAERHGVDEPTLDDLRRRAGNASGPEVAATARNLTEAGGGPPDWVPGGPPDDRGPPGDAPGDGPDGEPGDGGPPADPGDGGPPDDPGDGGPPVDADDSDGDAEGDDGEADEGSDEGSSSGDGGDGGPPGGDGGPPGGDGGPPGGDGGPANPGGG